MKAIARALFECALSMTGFAAGSNDAGVGSFRTVAVTGEPFEIRPTEIDGLALENVTCGETVKIVDAVGDARKPVRNLSLCNMRCGKIRKDVQIGTWVYDLEPEEDRKACELINCEGVRMKEVDF